MGNLRCCLVFCFPLVFAGLVAAILLSQSDALPDALPAITSMVRRRKPKSLRLRQARQLLRLFRGRNDHVAVAQGKGFAPEPLTEPLSPERLAEEHLAGSRCLGFYLMTQDNMVWCSCSDFDNKPEKPDPDWRKKAKLVYRFLVKHGLTPLVEISQSGSAAHIWMFFNKPIPAGLVRAFWRGVFDALKIALPEIYPRQDRLTGKELGNLVRYPLWNRSQLVDVTADWKRLLPIKTMSSVSLTSLKQLKQVTAKIGIDLDAEPQKPAPAKSDTLPAGELPARVKKLLENDDRLAARWAGNTEGLADTSRSSVVMSLACLLVYRYVPTPEIEAAIRYWCAQQHYQKGGREDWIRGVIERAYDFVGDDLYRKRRHRTAQLPRGTPDVIRKSFAREVARKAANKNRRML